MKRSFRIDETTRAGKKGGLKLPYVAGERRLRIEAKSIEGQQ